MIIYLANSVVLTIALILWVILLLTTSHQTYPGIFPLQKYGMGIIVLFVMGFLLGYLFQPDWAATGWSIIHIVTALNYLFLLDFARQLNTDNTKKLEHGYKNWNTD
jgi:hypothetical protein